jgi:hypothetical protein
MTEQQALNLSLAVVWFVAALVGAAYTAWCVLDAERSRRAVYRLNGPAPERAALEAVRQEQLRLVVQLVMVATGLVVLSPLSPDDRATVVRFLLVSIPIVLMVKSIRSRRARQWIVAYALRYVGRRSTDGTE